MKGLARFLSLAPLERRFLLKTALLLGAAEVSLHVFSLERVRHLLATLSRVLTGRCSAPPSAGQIVRAARVAGRHLPWVGSCLTQALVVQALFHRWGYPAHLRIGIARGEQGQFQAHAWLQDHSGVVIGGRELGRYAYTPLPPLEGEQP
ncbi:MAG: lasso peptide biosynthesis B2 protein [Acidobacteriota bacterium]